MGKKILAVLCLTAILLCGCVQQEAPDYTTPQSTTQPTRPTESVPPETTQPAEPETFPPITEPALEHIPDPINPVTELTCAKWVTFPQLLSLGDGKVVASQNYYSRKQGSYVNYLQIMDIYSDTLLYEATVNSTLELVLQRFDNGTILCADPASLTYYVYSSTLELTDSFTVPATGGYFSYDCKHYYHIDADALYRMDTATGNRSRILLEHDLRLESLVGIHPTEELLVARVYLSAYSDDCALAVIDAASGKLRLLSDTLKHLWLTGDSFYGVRMNDTAYGFDVYMGTLTGDEVKCLPASEIGTDQMGWNVLPGSHILVRRYAPDDEPRNTTLLDLKTNTMVDLDQYGFVDCTFGSIWLYEEQLIMGFYEQGDYFIPVLLDPKAMTFTEGPVPQTVQFPELVDDAVIDRYLDTVEQPTLDATLTNARTQADGLEEAYGITIQLARQTEKTCQVTGRTAQTVTDAAQIEGALAVLETELKKYPADFFHTLHNSIGEGGLILCLTGTVEGSNAISGFAELTRNHYIIGLDITGEELAATLHHELWHVIEMRLSTDTFDTASWTQCNPSGFRYYGTYDSGYQSLTKWTWAGGGGSNSCFVDGYARVNAREDRARIWEAAMLGDPQGCLSATALKQKLEIMTDALSPVFPTDNAPWAQYL